MTRSQLETIQGHLELAVRELRQTLYFAGAVDDPETIEIRNYCKDKLSDALDATDAVESELREVKVSR